MSMKSVGVVAQKGRSEVSIQQCCSEVSFRSVDEQCEPRCWSEVLLSTVHQKCGGPGAAQRGFQLAGHQDPVERTDPFDVYQLALQPLSSARWSSCILLGLASLMLPMFKGLPLQ